LVFYNKVANRIPISDDIIFKRIIKLGLTQKAVKLLFECFAKQNLPQTRQKAL
jgi:hypothetical protein